VKLVIGDNRRVNAKIENCSIKIGEQQIQVDLNILPLRSYDVFIEMDWLEKHWSLLDCKEKTINFLDKGAIKQEIQGIKRVFNL